MSTPAFSLLSTMGSVLGLSLKSDLDTLRIVHEGISSSTYQRVAYALQLPADLVAPPSTVRRRLSSKSRFTLEESERLVRLTRVFSEALQLFGGDKNAALSWFATPAEIVQGQNAISPMKLSATEAGARLVESRIQRTVHGFL